MKYFLLVISCLVSIAVAVDKNDYQKIKPEMFIDYFYSLVSDTAIEQYTFSKDGIVIANLGTKELVTGPVLHWKIQEEKTLIISDSSITNSFVFKTITETNAVTISGHQFRREKVRQDIPVNSQNR